MINLSDAKLNYLTSLQISASQFEKRREPYLRYETYEYRSKDMLNGIKLVGDRASDPSLSLSLAGLMASMRRRLWFTMNWLSLQYSAGVTVELFADMWPYAINWAEEFAKNNEAYDNSPEAGNHMTPHAALRTEDYWTVALRLTCFGLLSGNAAEMPRVIHFLDYCNEDMGVRDGLLERLVAPFIPGRGTPPDTATRHLPYRKLFKVFDAAPEKRPALIAKYLDEWYHASRREPYIDQHALENRTDHYFYGYWSWEAAAVTWLLNIDDSSYRDKPFYPRDLVDFARRTPNDAAPPSVPPL